MPDPNQTRQSERQAQAALNAYVQSEAWNDVEGAERESSIGFVKLFLDISYKELGVAPHELDSTQLRELLLARFARRIAAKRRGAEHAVAVLHTYYESSLESKMSPACKKVFNRLHNAPREEGICDACGAALITRPDDRPEAVAERLKVYAEMTAPLIGYYEQSGKLIRVNADRYPCFFLAE